MKVPDKNEAKGRKGDSRSAPGQEGVCAMNDERLVDVAAAAYAALGLVLTTLGGESARVLETQARQAQVIREVPARTMDLDLPASSPKCDFSDGPLPVRAVVIGVGGEPVGEFIVWVRSGRLSGLEQAWFTDEPPQHWPSVGELVFA